MEIYYPLSKKIESNLLNWSKLCLSLLGRINISMMIVVPQSSYITYMLPLDFPTPLLDRFNRVAGVAFYGWIGNHLTIKRNDMNHWRRVGSDAQEQIVTIVPSHSVS